MKSDRLLEHLSVIIPVHGSVHDLLSCLDSLGEVLSLGAEGILVFDGPNSSLLRVANLYRARWKSVGVFVRPKSGPGPVRNFGIHISNREYVYFLDVDDRLNSAGFVRNYLESTKYKPDVVRAAASVECRIPTHERDSERNYRRYGAISSNFHLLQGSSLKLFVSRGKNITTSSGLHLFRRKFLLKHKIEFDRESPEEDVRFVNFAYFYAESLFLSPEQIFIRVIRDGSLSTQSTRVNRRPYVRLVVEVAQRYRDNRYPGILRLMGFGKAMLEKELKRNMQSVLSRKTRLRLLTRHKGRD